MLTSSVEGQYILTRNIFRLQYFMSFPQSKTSGKFVRSREVGMKILFELDNNKHFGNLFFPKCTINLNLKFKNSKL